MSGRKENKLILGKIYIFPQSLFIYFFHETFDKVFPDQDKNKILLSITEDQK